MTKLPLALKNLAAILSLVVLKIPAVQVLGNGGVALPPRVNNEPITIRATLYVDDIGSIDVQNMDFRIDYYFVEEWQVPSVTCSTYLKGSNDYLL